MQHDERRQVFVHAAQTIRKPRAGAWAAWQLAAGLNVCYCRVVVDGFGMNRLDDCQVVDHLCSVRQQFADSGPVGAVLSELKDGRSNRETLLSRCHRCNALAVANRIRQVLIEPIVHFRLVIPHVQLRRSTRHEQVDDSFGPGGKVRQSRDSTRGIRRSRGAVRKQRWVDE